MLRSGAAEAAARAAAGEAAREAEACALLVELAAGETKVWKEVRWEGNMFWREIQNKHRKTLTMVMTSFDLCNCLDDS